MVPIRHNDNSPALCKTTGNKNAKPPDPKDIPPNSSLLKALEAIVAAGRRGLLGPAAMVAAESVPALNLEGSNGVASQEDLNPIPLVAGLEKRKKTVNEKRRAVITVVSSAEGAGSLQPTPKEIWICGNSVILASKKRAKSHPHGLQLGISTSRADVYWHGIQTMMWKQLMPLLHEIYHLRSPPSLIIIHLGEDDLLPQNNISLIISMKNDLGILKRAFPDTVIVWSSLLPRRIWKKDQKPEHMEKAQKHVNKAMVDYCNKIGVHFLSHNLITSDKSNIFLPDVNDLSDEGADIFIADLKKVLRLYQILE
ncbi:matrix-remodeling-associated protein 7 isoform 1-T1 [Liasis olivaceus]